MIEPKRLLEGDDATDLERVLLSAVRKELPAPRLRLRMMQGVLISGPLLWGARAKAFSTTLGGKAAIAVAIAGGAAASGAGAYVAIGSQHAPAEKAHAESLAPEPAPPGSPPDGQKAAAGHPPGGATLAESPAQESRDADDAIQPEAGETAQAPPVAPDAREAGLREEVQLLDAARSALTEGAFERAEGLLARYSRAFPEGTLSQEAQALHGRIARARALGR